MVENQPLTEEDLQALNSLKATAGWQLLKRKLIPDKIRQLERYIARNRFENLSDVYLTQSLVKAYDGIIDLVENNKV